MPAIDANPPDMSSWWNEDELETCPRCGDRKLAPPSPSPDAAVFRVCLACGLLPEPRESA